MYLYMYEYEYEYNTRILVEFNIVGALEIEAWHNMTTHF